MKMQHVKEVSLRGWVEDLAVSADGRFAVAATKNATEVIDLTNFTVRSLVGGQANVVVLSPDGRQAIVGIEDEALAVALAPETSKTYLVGKLRLTGAAFSADGTVAITRQFDKGVSVWDTSTWEKRGSIPTRKGKPAALSPDNRLIAYTDWDSGAQDSIRLVDVGTRAQVGQFGPPQGFLTSLQFSPDGRYLMTGGGGPGSHFIQLWDYKTGQQIRRFVEPERTVNSSVFSPDGQRLLSLSGPPFDCMVRLWDAITGQQLCEAKQSGGDTRAIRFLPDGRRFLSTETNDLHLWEIVEA